MQNGNYEQRPIPQAERSARLAPAPCPPLLSFLFQCADGGGGALLVPPVPSAPGATSLLSTAVRRACDAMSSRCEFSIFVMLARVSACVFSIAETLQHSCACGEGRQLRRENLRSDNDRAYLVDCTFKS